MRTSASSSIGAQPPVDDADELVQSLAGADDDEGVAAAEPVGGRRRREHTVLAHDRDDRAPRESAGLGVAERPTHVRRVRAHRDLLHVQPGDLLAQPGELRQDQRAAEHLRQRDGLVIRQFDGLVRTIRIVLVGDRELATPVAEVDDRQASAVVGDDVVPHADSRQLDTFDMHWHTTIMAPGPGISAIMDPWPSPMGLRPKPPAR